MILKLLLHLWWVVSLGSFISCEGGRIPFDRIWNKLYCGCW